MNNELWIGEVTRLLRKISIGHKKALIFIKLNTMWEKYMHEMEGEQSVWRIPHNPSGTQIVGKLLLALFIGILMALMIFIMVVVIWTAVNEAVANRWRVYNMSPLIPLMFMSVTFIATIIGNIILNWVYNIIWPDKYYDFKKSTVALLLINLFIMIFIGFMYYFTSQVLQDIDKVFLTFGFHIFFSIFISIIVIESVTNPNYSISHIVWSTIWFMFVILFFVIIFNIYATKPWDSQKYIILFPPILWFPIITLFSTLWEKLYYKFYLSWNDFFYTPSIDEILIDEEEVDEVNVDLESTNA